MDMDRQCNLTPNFSRQAVPGRYMLVARIINNNTARRMLPGSGEIYVCTPRSTDAITIEPVHDLRARVGFVGLTRIA